MTRSRRTFTEAQKLAILQEAESTGNVCGTAKRHGIATSIVYSWRKKFLTSGKWPPSESESQIDVLKCAVSKIQRLQVELADTVIEKTVVDLRNGSLTPYLGAMIFNNMVKGTCQLAQLRIALNDQLKRLEPPAVPVLSNGSDDQTSPEERKAAEKLLVELIRGQMAAEADNQT